jgi:hypothetical protein
MPAAPRQPARYRAPSRSRKLFRLFRMDSEAHEPANPAKAEKASGKPRVARSGFAWKLEILAFISPAALMFLVPFLVGHSVETLVIAKVNGGEFITPILILCIDGAHLWQAEVTPGSSLAKIRTGFAYICIGAGITCLIALVATDADPPSATAGFAARTAFIALGCMIVALVIGTIGVFASREEEIGDGAT